jgi:hypothetical protein
MWDIGSSLRMALFCLEGEDAVQQCKRSVQGQVGEEGKEYSHDLLLVFLVSLFGHPSLVVCSPCPRISVRGTLEL